ncbi:hypothetical protein JTE90_017210 [Oedothorax gibbosus]|uniref:Uncharacterized protein n=1 Tax=Oedothorax gibbosus TaxID=931172 RepID=A0AAV6TK20_9ARAC|nr:hypothetical protein JTE90_017210 [Oedothorax gibbosus]
MPSGHLLATVCWEPQAPRPRGFEDNPKTSHLTYENHGRAHLEAFWQKKGFRPVVGSSNPRDDPTRFTCLPALHAAIGNTCGKERKNSAVTLEEQHCIETHSRQRLRAADGFGGKNWPGCVQQNFATGRKKDVWMLFLRSTGLAGDKDPKTIRGTRLRCEGRTPKPST